MELGGNIELHGFIEEEEADLIIIKKIVGRFTMHLTSQYENFEKLAILFEKNSDGVALEARVIIDEESYSANTTSNNQYLALDIVLKDIRQQLKKNL